MVKFHVVDVHMTPLEERQHTSHQNIEEYQIHMTTYSKTSPMSSGASSLLLAFVQDYPLLHKGLGHLAALYLLLLLVDRYKLSYHKTICYL